MYKPGFFISALLFTGVVFWGCKSKTSLVQTHPTVQEGFVNDAEERMQYELERLRDPATGRIPDFARQQELAFAATLPSDRFWVTSRSGTPVNFTNRGPVNVGGRTRAFGVDIENENRLLAGSCSGGMWLSTDAGKSWNMTTALSQLRNATCLVQDKRPGHHKVWYHGSGEAYGASASGSASGSYYLGDGLFKSIDNGETWTSVASTASNSANTFTSNWQLVWNVTMDPSAPDSVDIIYAATNGKIMRSANSGSTWTAVRSGNSYFTDVAVTNSGVAYATLSSDGSQKGIWRSTDGINWVNILPQNFPTSYKRIVIGIDPNNKDNVYFLAFTPGFGKKTTNYLGEAEYNSLYKYTYLKGNGADTGGVWLDLSANLPASGGPFDKWNVQGSYDMVVAVKPGDSNTVFIGGTNLYRSTTAFSDSTHTQYIGGYEQFGTLPTILSYENHHPDQHGVAFSPTNPNILFSYNDGGVFKTKNNTAPTVVWESLNNGYTTSMFYAVAIDHASKNNPVIIAGAQDNGSWFTKSANTSQPWVTPRGGDGSFCAIADFRSMYYFSIQNAKMMKTVLDTNGTKTSFQRIDPIGLKNPKFINPFILDPNNNNIMYLAGGKYLWKNSNLSGIPLNNGWDSISTNWVKWADSVPTANSRISAIEVCQTPQNQVYYGTDNRKLYRIDNADSGTPKAKEITSISPGPPFPSGANISSIAADPNDGNKVLVSFSNYNVYSLFYSENGGTNWAVAGGNLEPKDGSGPSVRWVKILPVADGTIYLCATSTGLYATKQLDGFNTVWIQQGSNSIGNSVCDMIDTRVSDGLVVVATHANGIFSANYTTVEDLVHSESIPAQNIHFTVFPNPAVNQLNLSFEVPIKEPITAEIWDGCGRIVSSDILNSTIDGDYSINVNALPSGIYYITAKSSQAWTTRQVILNK